MQKALRTLVGGALVVTAVGVAFATMGLVLVFLSPVGPSDNGPEPMRALQAGLGGLVLVALSSLVAYRLLSGRPLR